MSARGRFTSAVLAAGLLVLALTGSSGKGRGNPHATTTTSTVASTVAPTTSSATSTTTSTSTPSGDPIDALAASLGFPTRNPTLSDDFGGTAGTKPDAARWGAKSYTPGTSVVWAGTTNCNLDGNGNLDITATRRTDGLWDSCFLSGLHAYSGPRFVDVRAKVPAGQGTWAAPGWEWPAPYGAAPGPELDVSEQLGREPTTYHATLHYWDATGGDHEISTPIATGVDLSAGFHDYGMAVYPDHVTFLFDGTPKLTITEAQFPSTWVFDLASVVLNIDLDMGGPWAGPVDPALSSPVHELVDYERVYQ